MFGDPTWVSQSTIVGGDKGLSGCEVCYWAGEAVLEEAGWVNEVVWDYWDCCWDGRGYWCWG